MPRVSWQQQPRRAVPTAAIRPEAEAGQTGTYDARDDAGVCGTYRKGLGANRNASAFDSAS